MSYSLALLIERRGQAMLKKQAKQRVEFEKILKSLYRHPLKRVYTRHFYTAQLAREYGLYVTTVTTWNDGYGYGIEIPDAKSEIRRWSDYEA